MAANTGHSAAEGVGTAGHAGRLPPGVIEELLRSPRCRRLLTCLYERGEPVPVADLAGLLAGDDGNGEAPTADRRRARTEIYQTHLPRLTATGAVTFDSRLGTVELAGTPALAARLSAIAAGDRECGTKDK